MYRKEALRAVATFRLKLGHWSWGGNIDSHLNLTINLAKWVFDNIWSISVENRVRRFPTSKRMANSKNLGRLWLAYTELQGDFCMLQLISIDSGHFTQPCKDVGHAMTPIDIRKISIMGIYGLKLCCILIVRLRRQCINREFLCQFWCSLIRGVQSAPVKYMLCFKSSHAFVFPKIWQK